MKDKSQSLNKNQLKSIVAISIPLGLLTMVLFGCNVQSYVLQKDSAECRDECNLDYQNRRRLCNNRFNDDSERELCYNDSYDRYLRCLKTCEE